MKLCIAMDMASKMDNLHLAREISCNFNVAEIWVKVGLTSFIKDGHSFVSDLRSMGFNIFLDLKLYDIPNTVKNAALACADLGVGMLSLHVSSGANAMLDCSRAVRSAGYNLKLVGVTVLTSFDSENFRRFYNADIDDAMSSMVIEAYSAGLDGLVCSVHEIRKIRDLVENFNLDKVCGTYLPRPDGFTTVTPGIVLPGDSGCGSHRVCNLGVMYYKGDFVRQDKIKAAKLFVDSWEGGSTRAALNLLCMHKRGEIGCVSSPVSMATLDNLFAYIGRISAHVEIDLESRGVFYDDGDDQRRLADLDMAKQAGSDIVVLGRQIYESKDRLSTVRKALDFIGEA